MFASRFSVYSALTYNAYATSAFSQHSVLSAAGVAADITQLCAYPILAKLQDVGQAVDLIIFEMPTDIIPGSWKGRELCHCNNLFGSCQCHERRKPKH